MSSDRSQKLRRLLADAIPFPDRGRGFLVNTGSEFLVDQALAALGVERLEIVERDLLAARRLAAHYPDLTVRHAAHALPAPGDVVILPVDKDRRALFGDLAALAERVGPGGLVALYGARREGIEPALKYLAAFCTLEPTVARAGMRLALARPRDDARAEAPELPASYRAQARGVAAEVACRPGVFSWRGLDGATAVMLEHYVPRDDERLLDLGCGSGAVSALLLVEGRVRHATLLDTDALALEAARDTLALNGIGEDRATLIAGDAGVELPDSSFDLILCNPPFHRGFAPDRSSLQRMIVESTRLLAPRGRLLIVGPPAVTLGTRLEVRYRTVERLFANVSLELWRARQPRRAALEIAAPAGPATTR